MGILDGLFGGGARDRERLEQLRQLEDKRLAFAGRVGKSGIKFDDSLFVQTGGGFFGLCAAGEALYLVTGPAPGAPDEDFGMEKADGARMHFEPFAIPGEGGGGVLGFGKKGGRGYKLVIQAPGGERREVEFVPALQCVLDAADGASKLLSEARRRGNANFVWDFKPVKDREMDAIVARWEQRIKGASG